tara:strand:- start:260 stop:466 length:207 start_codon:yes stop_codon:yes gene_type:complete
MAQLAVDELIERLEITQEVLATHTSAGGTDSLIEAVQLATSILKHYVKPFSYKSQEDLKKHIDNLDRP